MLVLDEIQKIRGWSEVKRLWDEDTRRRGAAGGGLDRMMTALTESTVESAASAWLERTGGRAAHGPDIAPDLPAAERQRPLTRYVWLLQHAEPEGPGAIAAALKARRIALRPVRPDRGEPVPAAPGDPAGPGSASAAAPAGRRPRRPPARAGRGLGGSPGCSWSGATTCGSRSACTGG